MEEIIPSQPDSVINSGDGSILDKVLAESESKTLAAMRPYRIVNQVLSNLKSREREVIMARYGLANDQVPKQTLEEIGQRFGVTRERVRQIENATLKKIGKKYTAPLKPIWKLISSYLTMRGGVVEIEDLAQYLNLASSGAEAEIDRRALRLIMGTYDKVVPLRKFPLFKEGWAATQLMQDKLLQIKTAVKNILGKAHEPLAEATLIAQVAAELGDVDQTLISGTLRVDPEVGQDNKGKWGLMSWPLVAPRRIRDKVFLVLEELGKPVHFSKIAELIQAKYPTGKSVLSRTVHNELIGDKRFVLVGRGIYALKKWGYQPGVVADVIKEILNSAGRPLTVVEITAEVLKKRQVKKNTIVANLQNRALFRKVAKSTYALVEPPSSHNTVS